MMVDFSLGDQVYRSSGCCGGMEEKMFDVGYWFMEIKALDEISDP